MGGGLWGRVGGGLCGKAGGGLATLGRTDPFSSTGYFCSENPVGGVMSTSLAGVVVLS